MSAKPERQITYHSCLRCPDGRQYDRLKKSSISRAAAMSLQHHVEVVHPDHTGDWRELIGEKNKRKIGSIRAARSGELRKANSNDEQAEGGTREGTEATSSAESTKSSSVTTSNEGTEKLAIAKTENKTKKNSKERTGHWDPYAYAWVWDE